MNHLYYGDNLTVLRDSIRDESVDLIYLDPPFNSNASYNVLFKETTGEQSAAQIEAFDDTWTWDDLVSGRAVQQVRESSYDDAARMLDAMVGFLGKNAMTAYLAMMAVRLIELHRVLKPTGSLYLHCDPTASHYLKILLDAVFGAKRFGAEIIWKRTSAHSDAGQGRRLLGYQHDTIFQYMKSDAYIWNTQYHDYDESYEDKFYKYVEPVTGRRFGSFDITAPGGSDPKKRNPHYEFLGVTRYWRFSQERMERMYTEGKIFQVKPGAVPRQKRYLDEMPGTPLQDIWTDIQPLNAQAKERLGYPTQKPVALLERILAASSNPGDVVLDPFCGCGTTVHAAQKLGRQWIGIDVTHVAISLIETRMFDAFGDKAVFQVHGVPTDLASAQALFDRDDRTKKEFEKWACGLIKAYPQGGGKKGADGGIDGFFRFGREKEHKAVVSIKGGRNIGVPAVRELDAVVVEQKAQIGVFLTLHEPTKPMLDWARSAGTFTIEGFPPVPRIQIVTIAEALHDKDAAVNVRMRHSDTYKKAAREEDTRAQGALDL